MVVAVLAFVGLICMLFVSFWGLVLAWRFYGAHAKGLNRHALENLAYRFIFYPFFFVFCNIMSILMSSFQLDFKVEMRKIGVVASDQCKL